jgi:hypothetical protein
MMVFAGGGLADAETPESKPAQSPLDLKGKTLKQVFEELLPGMGGVDVGARRDPQQTWQTICLKAGAPGNEGLRAEACRLMCEKLGPQTPNPAREWLLRQLEHIGRDESVNAVAPLLRDDDRALCSAAIRCMVANPAAEATSKLLQALHVREAPVDIAVERDRQIAVLDALGYRGDPAAVPLLAQTVASSHAPTAEAAAHALGRIGTPTGEQALAKHRGQATGKVRAAIDDAWLHCADRRLHEGNTAQAAAIYRQLNRAEEPRPIRLAALRGAFLTAGDKTGTVLLETLSGSDPAARAVALGLIPDIDAGTLKVVAAGLERLPPAIQANVRSALAARANQSAKARP